MDICRRKFAGCLLGGFAVSRLTAANRPKLLVLVLLEQCRPDYLEPLLPQMGAGGFHVFYNKGAWFPDCRHLASGFSATGIATIATGAWPAQHGIVADSWYDRASKGRVRADEEGLLATTLMNQAYDEDRTRMWVVSMDATHGRLFAGTPGASLYWMDEKGQFQTNSEAPDWLQNFNDRKSPDSLHNARWSVPGVRPDAPPLRVLKYDPAQPKEFLELYRASPFAQEAEFDLANELITREGLGQSNTLDVLCIMEGSMALLGHEVGARSPLMEQMILQLDRRIESLLSQLTRATGDAGFNVVLTAAHAATDAPPSTSRARMAVNGEALAQRIDAGLTAHGMGRVEKYLYPFLYLDSDGFLDPEEVRKAAARVALDQAAVADYYTAGGDTSAQNEWRRRFRNSFHQKRSGDVMLSYRPEYVEDFGQGRGISYGSIYNYDTQVPLCFYGPQFRPGVYERNVEAVDIAPTLARVLGVGPPSSSMGRVLYEAFA